MMKTNGIKVIPTINIKTSYSVFDLSLTVIIWHSEIPYRNEIWVLLWYYWT